MTRSKWTKVPIYKVVIKYKNKNWLGNTEESISTIVPKRWKVGSKVKSSNDRRTGIIKSVTRTKRIKTVLKDWAKKNI